MEKREEEGSKGKASLQISHFPDGTLMAWKGDGAPFAGRHWET